MPAMSASEVRAMLAQLKRMRQSDKHVLRTRPGVVTELMRGRIEALTDVINYVELVGGFSTQPDSTDPDD